MKQDKDFRKNPIRILDQEPGPELLTQQVEERLLYIMAWYDCEPTSTGLKQLGVLLALKHEPALRCETPVDRRKGEGGAEPRLSTFAVQGLVAQFMREPGVSRSEAIERTRKWLPIGKVFPRIPTTRTIRNMLTPSKIKTTKLPRAFQRFPYVLRLREAAFEAAERIGKRRPSRGRGRFRMLYRVGGDDP